MEGFKVFCSLVVTLQHLIVLEGFQWSLEQQSNDVINVLLGSDVSLPCEYELTPREQREADIFHLITWTREDPVNSHNWAGLAISSSLTGPQVIYEYPEHIFTRNNTLFVKNVSVQDHTLYQCSFQSSFFTTPSTIRLDVQYKPTDTQLTSESETVEEGKVLEITCKARANPAPKYRFYRNGNLIGPSNTGVHTLNSASKSDDEGTYKCVPYNALGDGPEASIAVTVKVVAPDESKFAIWKFGAIGGSALLLVLIASVVAVFCTRKKRLAKKTKSGQSPASREDAKGSHVGPAIYGEQENGGHEVPHLNGAVSFSDLRASRQIPTLRGALSANDVRHDENNYVTIQKAHLGTRSVIHLVDSAGQNDSKL